MLKSLKKEEFIFKL